MKYGEDVYFNMEKIPNNTINRRSGSWRWQFIKFCAVGASNAFISLTIYYIITLSGFNYLLANTIAWIVSVFNAFFWNNRYVFKNDAFWLKTLIKTYMSYGVSFLLSMALLWLFVEKLYISQFIAPILVMAIKTPINFLINKYWAFRS